MRDGTFGVTGRVDPFPDPLVEALETHRFEPVRTLQWRNDELDFSSLAALKASLDEPAERRGPDEGAAGRRPGGARGAVARRGDRRQGAPARPGEAALGGLPPARLSQDRAGPARRSWSARSSASSPMAASCPDDWIAAQIRQSNHTEGDIDTLSSRIAQIRTWTFVANQPDWLAEPAAWRDETKAVEDALSDALHERLTKRFVDRRTSVLMRRLRENTMLEAEITPAGDVMVEGHHVGVLSRLPLHARRAGGGRRGAGAARRRAEGARHRHRRPRRAAVARRRPRHRAVARRLSALAGRADRAARRRRRRAEAALRHARRRAAFRPGAGRWSRAASPPGSARTSRRC